MCNVVFTLAENSIDKVFLKYMVCDSIRIATRHSFFELATARCPKETVIFQWTKTNSNGVDSAMRSIRKRDGTLLYVSSHRRNFQFSKIAQFSASKYMQFTNVHRNTHTHPHKQSHRISQSQLHQRNKIVATFMSIAWNSLMQKENNRISQQPIFIEWKIRQCDVCVWPVHLFVLSFVIPFFLLLIIRITLLFTENFSNAIFYDKGKSSKSWWHKWNCNNK